MRHSLAQAHALSGPAPHTTGLWAHGSTHPHTRFLLLSFPCTPPRLHRAPSCSSFPSPHLPTSPSPHLPTSPPAHLPTSPQTEMFPSPPHSPSPYTAAGMGSPALCPDPQQLQLEQGRTGRASPGLSPNPTSWWPRPHCPPRGFRSSQLCLLIFPLERR